MDVGIAISGVGAATGVVSAGVALSARKQAREARDEVRRAGRKPSLSWEIVDPLPGMPLRVEIRSDRDLLKIVVHSEWSGAGPDDSVFSRIHHMGPDNALRGAQPEDLEPARVNVTTGLEMALVGHLVNAGHSMMVNFLPRYGIGPQPTHGRGILRCTYWVSGENEPWVEVIDTKRVELDRR